MFVTLFAGAGVHQILALVKLTMSCTPMRILSVGYIHRVKQTDHAQDIMDVELNLSDCPNHFDFIKKAEGLMAQLSVYCTFHKNPLVSYL